MMAYKSTDKEFMRNLEEIVHNSQGTAEDKDYAHRFLKAQIALDDLRRYLDEKVAPQRAVGRRIEFTLGIGNPLSPIMVVLPWRYAREELTAMVKKVLDAAGWNENNVYITYADKFPSDTAIEGREQICKVALMSEIECLNPKCIVFLGYSNIKVFGEDAPRYQFFKDDAGRDIMITYSAADVLNGDTPDIIRFTKAGLWANVKEVLQRYKVC